MLANTGKFAGRTVFISGASRGIGREIALKLAKDKANIVIAAKTVDPHPKLPGTIYTVAKEIEEAGGQALPCIVDIRDEEAVKQSVEEAVKKFGGIDILINNASAISLTKTVDTTMKKYDLMHGINGRGTFLVSKACIPHLKKGTNPHILNISPPLNLQPRWFANHVAYTMAKYNMSLCALGMAEEFKSDGIAVNCIWPVTAIYTAAMEMLGGSGIKEQCRKPEIMADAAYAILSKDSKAFTGNFCVDEDLLNSVGIKDMSQYEYFPHQSFMPDFFLDETLNRSVHWSQYVVNGGAGPMSAGTPNKTEAAPATASVSNDEIGNIMKKIEGILSPEVVKMTNAIFQFDIKGDTPAKWYLDLKSGNGSVGEGDAPNKSDVVLSMASVDFVKMFSGKLSPTSAYMTGKLKMKGDITKAMALDKLMGKLKSKL